MAKGRMNGRRKALRKTEFNASCIKQHLYWRQRQFRAVQVLFVKANLCTTDFRVFAIEGLI